MKKRNFQNIIGLLFLIMSFGLNAQSTEMETNENVIDKDFVPKSETTINFQENKSKKDIILEVKRTSDSLFSIYLFNNTNDSLKISKQDWHLRLIQEAKNLNGEWKPIEYWDYPGCMNSYLSVNLEPNGILKTKSTAYIGTFKTQIRFKLLNYSRVYYSNPVNGFVNLSQFELPKNIDKYKTYDRVVNLGGLELFKKVIFLDPNGMKEWAKKAKENEKKYRAKLKKKNKN